MINTATTTQSQQEYDLERVREIEQSKYSYTTNNTHYCRNLFFLNNESRANVVCT